MPKFRKTYKHPIDTQICRAAKLGDVNTLQTFVKHKCHWNHSAYVAAVTHGHLYCLQFMFNSGHSFAHMNVDVCKAAASSGQLACLQYLHDKGFPWNEDTIRGAVNNEHVDCLMFALENGCKLKHMYFGWSFSNADFSNPLITAFHLGNYSCMVGVHKYGGTWGNKWIIDNNYVVSSTIKTTHDCLIYAYYNGCPLCPTDRQYCDEFQQTIKRNNMQKIMPELFAAALHPSRIAQWINDE